jgi:hypothetical protein
VRCWRSIGRELAEGPGGQRHRLAHDQEQPRETLELDGWIFAIMKREGKSWRAVEIDMLEGV